MQKLMERFFPDALKPYAGRVAMTALGFVLAVLCLTLGFWRTLLIAALCVAGYFVGKWVDGALDVSGLPVHHRAK